MLTQKGAALLACLALAAFSSSHAFAPVIGFAPSIQGSFVSSVRVPTLRTARSGRVTPSFSVLTVAAALRNAGMIGKPIPANYKEGEQYTMGGKFAVGDLVFVKRSDGTNRYGEIVGAAGLPWQDQWEVVVQLDGTDVGATRVELAKDIGKVLVGGAAAPSGGSMLIGRGATPSRAVPPPAKRGAPAPVRPTGTARVGSQRLTIPRGQQSARGQPARPPAPKAPAPKKISLVARAPPAQTPKPAARAAPAPTRTPSARVPAAKGAAAGKAAAPVVPFADKLSKTVPATWNEGEEYSAATQVEPRQLVLVDTATGLKFAVVLAKTGFFWQKNYRVATSVSPSGGVGSEEEVSIEALYKPTQAALDEMEQPVAAAAGFFAGLFKSLTGAKEEEEKKKAAPAFPKAAAKPPAAPPTGPLGSILGTIGSLIPEDKKEVKKEVAKPAPAAAKPSAATAPPLKAPAAKAPPGGGRVGSIANLAETASGAGRDVALGFLNGLSKVLGDDDSSPQTPPAKAPAPAAKAPDAKAAPAKAPAAPAPPKKEAPKKEEAKKEEVQKEEAKKEEVKKEARKKEEVKKEEVKAAAPKEEPKKEEPKPATCSSQGPPPGLGLKVPLAKKNALEENLRRAERAGDLNLGLGPEWEGWTPKEDDK